MVLLIVVLTSSALLSNITFILLPSTGRSHFTDMRLFRTPCLLASASCVFAFAIRDGKFCTYTNTSGLSIRAAQVSPIVLTRLPQNRLTLPSPV
jgi:hypothetical protein